MTEHSSHADLRIDRRLPKAEKIRLLLEASFAGGKSPRLLEIGTGSGVIAQFFSAMAQCRVVHAVDVSDQNQVRGGCGFQLFDGHRLPFAEGDFDAVLSNHMIEHVDSRSDHARHLAEISRPSRWQVVEPHFGLPFLSWIPRRYRDGYSASRARASATTAILWAMRSSRNCSLPADLDFATPTWRGCPRWC